MNDLEKIKDRIDIVELISGYINLKKAGRNYKANCPFHKEKTPSFMVSPEKQIWHCFGCQKGGDIFGFTMEMEGMDFVEALKFLAQKAGIVLEQKISTQSGPKNVLLELNNLAASFYHKILEESTEGEIARKYLQKRKVDKNTILDFRLGFAPKGFRKLLEFLQSKDYKKEDIIKAGLAVKKDNGEILDRFYNRLMFPIVNPGGAVLGFTGRILTEEKEAKYINTPETQIYEKSKILFGLDKAKKEIIAKNWVVVVEGNMDVLASYEAGVKNVVASSGTALTKDQIKIIKRYTSNVILSLDKDEAGSEALKRGIFLALEEGMNIKVANLGRFKDPDEMVKADKNLWKKALKESKAFIDFYFDEIFATMGELNVFSKKKAAAEIIPFLSSLKNSIEKAHYVSKLAQKLKVPQEAIFDTLKKIKTPKAAEEQRKNQTPKKDAQTLISETILGLILTFPVTVSEIASLLEEEDFEDLRHKKIFKAFKEIYQKKGDFKIDDVKDEELKSQLSEMIFVAEENSQNNDSEEILKEAKFCFKRLKENIYKKAKEELKFQIEEAENKKDLKKVNDLMNKIQQILAKEKEIKEF